MTSKDDRGRPHLPLRPNPRRASDECLLRRRVRLRPDLHPDGGHRRPAAQNARSSAAARAPDRVAAPHHEPYRLRPTNGTISMSNGTSCSQEDQSLLSRSGNLQIAVSYSHNAHEVVTTGCPRQVGRIFSQVTCRPPRADPSNARYYYEFPLCLPRITPAQNDGEIYSLSLLRWTVVILVHRILNV